MSDIAITIRYKLTSILDRLPKLSTAITNALPVNANTVDKVYIMIRKTRISYLNAKSFGKLVLFVISGVEMLKK